AELLTNLRVAHGCVDAPARDAGRLGSEQRGDRVLDLGTCQTRQLVIRVEAERRRRCRCHRTRAIDACVSGKVERCAIGHYPATFEWEYDDWRRAAAEQNAADRHGRTEASGAKGRLYPLLQRGASVPSYKQGRGQGRYHRAGCERASQFLDRDADVDDRGVEGQGEQFLLG